MQEMEKDIWVAIISATSPVVIALITAIVSLLQTRKKNREINKLESELRFEREALNFDTFWSEHAALDEELRAICRETCIDRFILLNACNGELSPEWTNAVWQHRDGEQKKFDYFRTRIDADYVDRLRQTVRSGSIVFKTSEVPDGLIKQIYENEGVMESAWFHIGSYQIVGTKRRAICYCSYSTHSDEEIDATTLTRLRLFVDRLRGVAEMVERADPEIVPAKEVKRAIGYGTLRNPEFKPVLSLAPFFESQPLFEQSCA